MNLSNKLETYTYTNSMTIQVLYPFAICNTHIHTHKYHIEYLLPLENRNPLTCNNVDTFGKYCPC